jgi:hypothetical protein
MTTMMGRPRGAKNKYVRRYDTQSISIPQEVIDRRNHEYGLQRTLHMTVLGDPLPGRSALDQRGKPQQAPMYTDLGNKLRGRLRPGTNTAAFRWKRRLASTKWVGQ